MAPIQPQHRTSLPTKSILKSSSTLSDETANTKKSTSKSSADSLFPSNKSDKRRIKHSALISKITKSHPSSQKPKRRRRPNKKLVTTLSSIADALPDSDDTSSPAETPVADGEGAAAAGYTPQAQVNVIKRKSVKSKPGALKRKQKMDNEERKRWAKNAAQLSGAGGGTGIVAGLSGGAANEGDVAGNDGVRDRWAALRGFIGQTLERRADINVKPVTS